MNNYKIIHSFLDFFLVWIYNIHKMEECTLDPI